MPQGRIRGNNEQLRLEGVFAAGLFDQVHFLFKRGNIHPIFEGFDKIRARGQFL